MFDKKYNGSDEKTISIKIIRYTTIIIWQINE